MSFLLLPTHPYLQQFKPDLYPLELRDGGIVWVVAWRDFFTARQKREFPTRKDAQQFVGALYLAHSHSLAIDDETVADVGHDWIAECDRFWREG